VRFTVLGESFLKSGLPNRWGTTAVPPIVTFNDLKGTR